MSLIAFASAKGSPGATTTALAVAAVWPNDRKVLLAEVDPAGSDLGPRFGLSAGPGLVQLGPLRRRRMSGADVWDNAQVLPGGTPVLIGASGPEQAAALRRLWPELAAVLSGMHDADVMADCGRLFPDSPAVDVLRHADLVVLVSRPTLEEVAHLQARLAAPLSTARVEVVLVGTGPYPPEQIEEALGLKLLGVLANDERAAALLAGRAGNERLLARSALIRSARTVAAAIASSVDDPRRHAPSASPVATAAPEPDIAGNGGRSLEARR
ncbi:MAG: hypothetical protein M3404_00735 [Actinomycetota bacterium]|nr:hypothetical protein [Actinomycetota bacterium]